MANRKAWIGLVGLLTSVCAASACSPAAEDTGTNEAHAIPGSVEIKATFRTNPSGKYMVAENGGGGAVNANRDAAFEWETFTIVDINGGSLNSGDQVLIRTFGGFYLMAADGGGAGLNAASRNELGWETFRLVKEGPAGLIRSGDTIGLQAVTRNTWVSAENAGGGPVFAYGAAFGPWERFTVGIGNAPPPPPPPPPPTGGGLERLLARGTFESMFPNRNGFYTYDGLVQATRTYPAFATSGSIDDQKREIAAFLGNVNHETGALFYIEEINKGDYCDNGAPGCPCARGQRYFGRGPIQLSWNYNYCTASQSIFGNREILRTDPGRVARESWLAWATGLFFWMTSTGAGSMTSHDGIVNAKSFGETIRTINGSLECNGRNGGAVNARVDAYLRFCRMLGVDPIAQNSRC